MASATRSTPGVEVQINSTITRANVHQLPALLALAERLGAVSFHPFMLVPTGRGKDLRDQELAPEEYERALEWMFDAQQSSALFLKPTDVPHYWRVMRQRAKAGDGKIAAHPHAHGGMDTLSRGCLAGARLLLRLARRSGAALRLLRRGRRRCAPGDVLRHLA